MEPAKGNLKEHGDLGNLLFILAAVSLVSLIAFAGTWRNIRFANLLYEISRLEKEKKEVYEEVEKLRLRVAEYSTPERIEKLYRDKMGIFPVQASDRIISVELPEIKLPKTGAAPIEDEDPIYNRNNSKDPKASENGEVEDAK